MTLLDLSPGDRFATLSGKRGTLLYVSELRARVKWDNDARHVELEGASFEAPGRPQDVASGTEVCKIHGPQPS